MRREKLILGVFLVIIIFVFFDALLGLKVFHKNFNDDMFLEQIEKTSTKKNIKEDIPVYVEEWTKDIFHNRSGVYNSWFKLTGITKFENGYKAIINGEILDEMSYIRGFSVEEITKNQVKLERNDYQVTLNLEE